MFSCLSDTSGAGSVRRLTSPATAIRVRERGAIVSQGDARGGRRGGREGGRRHSVWLFCDPPFVPFCHTLLHSEALCPMSGMFSLFPDMLGTQNEGSQERHFSAVSAPNEDEDAVAVHAFMVSDKSTRPTADEAPVFISRIASVRRPLRRSSLRALKEWWAAAAAAAETK